MADRFADFEQFQVDTDFANFEKVKIDPIWVFFNDFGQLSYFTEFGQDMQRKTIQTLSVWSKSDKKFKNHA